MSPPNLQGLNVVHPVSPVNDSDILDLSSPSNFPDLTAQLDIWSNLAFQSDEPLMNNFTAPPPQSPLLLNDSIAQLLALYGATQTPQPATEDPSTSQYESFPPSKRPRARKTSVSTVDETESTFPSTSLNAAEDKRRRNTAASARFRLKKKEREAALETKAKELEVKVTELERECEALRRENGWLKGLVVGVTGAAQQPATTKRTPIPAKDEPHGDQ